MSALRQHVRLWTRFGPTLGALCLGCQSGGQTGGELGNPVPADSACAETIRELALDDAGSLGFSGADVLAGVLGTHGAPLFWNADTAPLGIGPEQGESSIEISIERSGAGPVRYVDLAALGVDTGPYGTTAASRCADRLEIVVSVRLSTGGGAFGERFDATLVASSLDSVALARVLAAEDVLGSFTVSAPASVSAPAVFVDVKWDEQGFHGTLSGQLVQEQRDGVSGSVRMLIYAAWPEPRANTSP